MARLVVALDNQHQAEAVIGDEWLRIWPDDFTFIRYVDDGGDVPVFTPAVAEVPDAATPDPEPAVQETGGNHVSQNVSQTPDPTPAPQTGRHDMSETGSFYLPNLRSGN